MCQDTLWVWREAGPREQTARLSAEIPSGFGTKLSQEGQIARLSAEIPSGFGTKPSEFDDEDPFGYGGGLSQNDDGGARPRTEIPAGFGARPSAA